MIVTLNMRFHLSRKTRRQTSVPTPKRKFRVPNVSKNSTVSTDWGRIWWFTTGEIRAFYDISSTLQLRHIESTSPRTLTTQYAKFRDRIIVEHPFVTNSLGKIICPECKAPFSTRAQYFRHMGVVHEKFKKWLKEENLVYPESKCAAAAAGEKSRSRSPSLMRGGQHENDTIQGW